MTRIVISDTYGGFGLSPKAQKKYNSMQRVFKLIGELVGDGTNTYADRAYPHMIWAVETTRNPDGVYAALKIVDIPDGVPWTIQEYDGSEWVAERHRTWS